MFLTSYKVEPGPPATFVKTYDDGSEEREIARRSDSMTSKFTSVRHQCEAAALVNEYPLAWIAVF